MFLNTTVLSACCYFQMRWSTKIMLFLCICSEKTQSDAESLGCASRAWLTDVSGSPRAFILLLQHCIITEEEAEETGLAGAEAARQAALGRLDWSHCGPWPRGFTPQHLAILLISAGKREKRVWRIREKMRKPFNVTTQEDFCLGETAELNK